MDDKTRNTLILLGTLVVLVFMVTMGPSMLSAVKELTFKQFLKNSWIVILGGSGVYMWYRRKRQE